jgi:hypothetical protein
MQAALLAALLRRINVDAARAIAEAYKTPWLLFQAIRAAVQAARKGGGGCEVAAGVAVIKRIRKSQSIRLSKEAAEQLYSTFFAAPGN